MEWKTLARSFARSPSRSIGTKVFLLFFCFVCLSVASLGVFSFTTARSAMMAQTESNSGQAIVLAGEKLDMKQQFYLDLTGQLIKNSEFVDNLFQFANASTMPAGELDNRIAAVRDLLDQLILSDPRIRDMTLYSLEDAVPPISTDRENTAWDENAAWVRKVKDGNGRPIWLPIEDRGYRGNSPKPVFAYGRMIGKMNTGSSDYVLLVQIEASVLESMIGGVRISPSAETALFGEDGKPLISTLGAAGLSSLQVSAGQDEEGQTERRDDRFFAYRKSPVTGWTLAGIAPLKELTGATDRIRTTTYAAIGVSVLLALIAGIWLVAMIGSPLGKLESLMGQAAGGDLRGRLRHRGKDEIGRVAEAYNRMMEQIAHLIRETRSTVDEVAASSGELAGVASQTADSSAEIHLASEQIATGAVELAANAERTSVRVDELGQCLAEVLVQQDKMAAAAREAFESCRIGSRDVEELLRKSDLAEIRLRQAGGRVNGLAQSAASIRELLGFMTQMAKQTTILSLNASIEATRAGAAGAGFKVIAEEIRRLADRSNASIAHAEELIEAIRSEVDGTADTMADALPFFGDMAEGVHEVHRHFTNVRGSMDHMLELTNAVTGAVRELEYTQNALSMAMQEVSAVSEESSASSEQVASLCSVQMKVGESLLEISNGMKEVSGRLENQMTSFIV
ncbi:methyl-accepting chemotaxis protein [Cohnella candidum]|uniref:HAMP domain-containing protein n=1 Tax=Cohnella candidum TaxID=2674991 RepID=A0A3G3JTS0_9BACL|nr:methyl-accepting chemotaxis protein [Cohnella candidum]AYQ71594.1 HAMP domain-containing protein [Cohnella candidum]